MVHPRRVNWLINHSKFRVCFQPLLGFTTFMDYVIIHDQRDGFCPPVSGFQVLQQTDKQHRTFAVATYIADFTRSTVQCPGQVVFFILPRRYHAFLLPAKLPVCTDFWIEMDIHFILIKDRMFCTAFVQRFMYCCHFFIFMWVTDTQCRCCPAPYQSG